MNPFLLSIGLITLTVSGKVILPIFAASASEDAKASLAESSKAKAVYTQAGMRRIQENIGIVNENIKDTETSLQNIDKNISTVKAEITEIKSLVEDYSNLKAKFLAKVRSGKEEANVNGEALKKLQKFLKTLELVRKKQGDTQAIRMQIDNAMREIGERERWNLDASEKVKRLEALITSLDSTSRLVKSKQPNLEKELAVWKRQWETFSTALSTFQKQKQEYEELLIDRGLASAQ